MIRRDAQSDIYLIAQHDHALLAGELLQHVGNTLFAPPSPFKSVLHAVSQHDLGWQIQDNHPTLNPQGRPAHVFEITSTIARTAWADSVAQAAAADPYAGLLVSLHAMNLAASSATHIQASDRSARRDMFHLQQFIQRQADLQESLRKRLGMHIDLPLRGGLCEPGRSDDEDLLLANFHLLQMLDQLSLDLCFDRLIFDRIADVYPRPMGDSVTIRIDRPESGMIRIDRWPFDAQRLDFKIPAKRLPNRTYRDAAEIAADYSAANPELLEVTLTTWQ